MDSGRYLRRRVLKAVEESTDLCASLRFPMKDIYRTHLGVVAQSDRAVRVLGVAVRRRGVGLTTSAA